MLDDLGGVVGAAAADSRLRDSMMSSPTCSASMDVSVEVAVWSINSPSVVSGWSAVEVEGVSNFFL